MAYFSTEPAFERRNATGKNRVWDFFRLSNETHRANRRQPAQPRRKILPTATKPVSGIPYWPSRDPIGEEGGENLYEFVLNRCVLAIDRLGWDIFYPDGKPNAAAPDWNVVDGAVPDGNQEGIECDGKGNARIRKGTGEGLGCCQKCVVLHEQSHANDVNGQKGNPCKDRGEGSRPVFTDAAVQRATEMKAYKAELACIRDILKNIDKEPKRQECERNIRARILTISNALRGLEELPEKKGQKKAVPLSYPDDPTKNGYYDEGLQKIRTGDYGGVTKIITDIMSK